jgi:F-type H+-transporting ATPase subunit b
MLLQVNSTLFFQIVNFLLLIWILNKLMFRPFLDLVERRKEETEGTRKKAEDITDRAESVKGTYDAGVSEAATAAAAMNEAQRKAGREEGERIMGEARTGSAAYLDSARNELQAGLDVVRKQVDVLSTELAGEMARKILGRNTG